MRKFIFVNLLCSIVLVGCGNSDNDSKSTSLSETSTSSSITKLEELSSTQITLYLERLTGKYATLTAYERGSTNYKIRLEEIILECNDVSKELAFQLSEALPEESVQAQLIQLSKLVIDSAKKLEQADYSNSSEDFDIISGRTIQIAETFNDGELPPSIEINLELQK